MNRTSFLIASLMVGLAFMLSSCLSRSDALAPIVTIYNPKSGAISTTTNLFIDGYAMDDRGISAIKINGSDLLATEVYASERGKKLIQFRFQIPNLNEGNLASTILVEDTSGRSTSLAYELQIDTTPPGLELSEVTPLSDGSVRVVGIARDNIEVSRLSISGTPLSFVPAAEVPFDIDVDVSESRTIVLRDTAGNETAQDF